MAIGPGKYDKQCARIREETGAAGIILIVFGGEAGSGFSMQASFEITLATPAILRQVADLIEADIAIKQ